MLALSPRNVNGEKKLGEILHMESFDPQGSRREGEGKIKYLLLILFQIIFIKNISISID